MRLIQQPLRNADQIVQVERSPETELMRSILIAAVDSLFAPINVRFLRPSRRARWTWEIFPSQEFSEVYYWFTCGAIGAVPDYLLLCDYLEYRPETGEALARFAARHRRKLERSILNPNNRQAVARQFRLDNALARRATYLLRQHTMRRERNAVYRLVQLRRGGNGNGSFLRELERSFAAADETDLRHVAFKRHSSVERFSRDPNLIAMKGD